MAEAREPYSFSKKGPYTSFKDFTPGVYPAIGKSATWNEVSKYEDPLETSIKYGYEVKFDSPLAEAGDLLTRNATEDVRFPFISNYKFLMANNAASTRLQWVDLNTTKGDVLTHNGTQSIRQGVGSNDQALIADSVETNGIKWSDSSWLPNRHRNWFRIQINGASAASAPIQVGTSLGSVTTSGTASLVEDSTGTYLNYVNAGALNSTCGWDKSTTLQNPAATSKPMFTWVMKTGASADDITSCRIAFAILDGMTVATFATTDVPAANYIGFRYTPDVDGSAFWRATTNDGGASPTVTVTSVSIATDTRYVLQAYMPDSSTVKYYINGTLVATHTTDIPSFGASRLMWAGLSNDNSAVARNIRIAAFQADWT